MIKAVFFDIDGTLISWRTKKMPPSVRPALERLREKGILCIVATGRSLFEIQEGHMLDGLTFDAYLLNSGRYAVDNAGNCFFSTPVDSGDLSALLSWVEQTGVSCWMVNAERSAINHVTPAAEKAMSDISTAMPAIADLHTLCRKPVYKFALFLPPEKLPTALLPHCSNMRWHESAHDLFSNAGGKEKALHAALSHFGLRREECMAFGDSDNDIEMLRYAGIGVAMGAAEDCVKDAADYVTADCDDDGILLALEHYHVMD